MECSPQHDGNGPALEDLADDRGDPAGILLDRARRGRHVAAVDHLDAPPGEQIPAEVEIVVAEIARGESHGLLPNGLGSGAAYRGTIEIVGDAEGNTHHREIGIQDVEVAAAGHVEHRGTTGRHRF
jgi:hypothetical protein